MPAKEFAVRFALPLVMTAALVAMSPQGMAAAAPTGSALTFTPVADYEWPNALRDLDGPLRLVVRGPAVNEDQTSVLAFQRSL